MNIQDAKDEIKRTLRTYTRKKPSGEYLIPTEKQRPILLIGPPGIGKTAIMQQIAEESDMGLVAYTMTHHTRQSAIGLPMVRQRQFDGKTVSVTEYTMSEIVASLHIYMEETGHREGILFLDEINCVSETLTPVMLQLLQNKTFGTHALPPGWLIVAAGNPPEYNRSVRELDMVTLDRVKNMDIEADLEVWQKYALRQKVHPAIRAYLSVYPDHFYCIQSDRGGRKFVTARGWEDLSTILKAYEAYEEEVTDSLFLQYIQHDEIAGSFALFYRLYQNLGEEFRGDASRDGYDIIREYLAKGTSPLECLAASAMLFHRIEQAAGNWQDMVERNRSEKSLLSLIHASGNALASLDDRKKALHVRHEQEIIRTEDFLRESRLLDQVSRFVLSEEYRSDPRAAVQDRIIEMSEEEEALGLSVSHDAEYSCRILQLPGVPRSCLIYFVSDLTQNPDICQILARWPSPAYQDALGSIPLS